MKTILIITLLGLTLVASYDVDEAAVSTKDHSTSQFMVGMLRGDGTVVPFAQFGNSGWWNPWPKPRQTTESIYAESTEVVHNSLADLPEPWFTQCEQIPTPWFFWSSAETPIVLGASEVVRVTAHSGTNWALSTDFPKRTSKDPLHDIIGVAVNIRQKIEPFVEIDTAGPQTKEISSFVKEIFDVNERAESAREQQPNVEMSLTKLYRSNSLLNGKHVYYFQAEKQYPKPATSRDAACNDVSLFQGWISKDESGLGLSADRLMFTDCDRKGPSTMIPLGTMTLKDRVFLFVREHGWEQESYTILELDKSGLHRVLQTVGA